ncbi:4-coumarate--CoA ligase 3 [Lucilia cuprina]|nr:4-coumarate--CoA ligase 3 [Lucilia cuprina]
MVSIVKKTIYHEAEKIWSGIKTKPEYGEKDSIGKVIFESLQRDPEGIGQISHTTGKELTNKEILLLSIRVAQHLEDLNIKQGEIVGICAANTDYLACLVFGCLFRGLVISTLDTSFDKDGIKHIYSITKPKLMFCDGVIYNKIKDAFEECNLQSTVIYTINDYLEEVPKLSDFLKETQRENDFKCVELADGFNQLAAILCSSGTTGLPKGVCITHCGILNQIYGLTPTKGRFLCFSTLYWISGVIGLLIATARNITRIICAQPYTPECFIDIVKKYKITISLGPPSQMGLLLSTSKLQQNDLDSLEFIYIGGSAVPISLVDKLRTFTKKAIIYVVYGQTENCANVSGGIACENFNCGQLVPNVEIKIINENSHNLGPGEVGEICTRSSWHWPGYYGNPEATADTYDSEKWIHSGDLGYFNDKGELFIVDRIKDILKYNNFHFYPTEIETVILELNDIVEVCVFGVADLIYTHLPAAAIVKSKGSNITGIQIYQHVYQRMVDFKNLRGGVYFLNELPKTATGKVLRSKVAELCKNIKNELLNN